MEDVTTISGAEELDRKFADAGRKVAIKHAKLALREGAKVIQREERRIAPFRTGNLDRSISILAGKTTPDSVSVRVVPGGKWFKGNLYYAAFQNFGWFTGKRIRKVGGLGNQTNQEKYHEASLKAGRRFIPGKFFAQKAFDNKKAEAEQVIGDKLQASIAEDWNA